MRDREVILNQKWQNHQEQELYADVLSKNNIIVMETKESMTTRTHIYRFHRIMDINNPTVRDEKHWIYTKDDQMDETKDYYVKDPDNPSKNHVLDFETLDVLIRWIYAIDHPDFVGMPFERPTDVYIR